MFPMNLVKPKENKGKSMLGEGLLFLTACSESPARPATTVHSGCGVHASQVLSHQSMLAKPDLCSGALRQLDGPLSPPIPSRRNFMGGSIVTGKHQTNYILRREGRGEWPFFSTACCRWPTGSAVVNTYWCTPIGM